MASGGGAHGSHGRRRPTVFSSGKISLPVDRRVQCSHGSYAGTAMSYRSSSFSTTILVPVRHAGGDGPG